jgi:hypothetical protein
MQQNGYGSTYSYAYEFNLIDSKDVNAWCMSGGNVFILEFYPLLNLKQAWWLLWDMKLLMLLQGTPENRLLGHLPNTELVSLEVLNL